MKTQVPLKESNNLSYCLYIIATPIGNIGDMTIRGLETLLSVDIILCEDTRTSGKLLSAYDINTKKMAYHEHNANSMRPKVIKMLKEGKKIALISDAGMPLISDPGYKLVEDCIAEDVSVTCIPGASASLTALALSGLPSDKFTFAGFLPNKTGARKKALLEVAPIPTTLIFYETAPRLIASLKDMHEVLGDRQTAVARELTKKFEEVKRGKLTELIAHYEENGAPKGEIVIVVEAGSTEAPLPSEDELKNTLQEMIDNGMSVKDASTALAETTGIKKRDLYNLALTLKD